jgi:hypothetical protein
MPAALLFPRRMRPSKLCQGGRETLKPLSLQELMHLQRSGRGGTLVREGSYLSLELDRTVVTCAFEFYCSSVQLC